MIILPAFLFSPYGYQSLCYFMFLFFKLMGLFLIQHQAFCFLSKFPHLWTHQVFYILFGLNLPPCLVELAFCWLSNEGAGEANML